MTSAIYAAALGYAQPGGLVLPIHTPAGDDCSCRRAGCEHPGKHPRTMNGKDGATSDVDTVKRWLKMWPTTNLALRPAVGQVVLDVDVRHGGDVQLAAMQKRCGPLPATLTARTGSGGQHLWFLLDGDVRGKLAPGIDVKTNTGYLVVPPSVHACGGSYEWTDLRPIAPAPAYLRSLLKPPPLPKPTKQGKATPAAAAALLRLVAEAKPGHRNSLLYWACCRAFERGIDINPLVDAAVQNGLTRSAAEATAASAAKAPPRKEVATR